MLWHGMLDESHPIQMGERIASELPQCRPIYVDGVGSLGFIEHAESIFNELFSQRPRVHHSVTPVEATPLDEEADIFAGLLEVLPEPLAGE